MSDVTRILQAIDHGDPQASSRLLPLVYEELRRLARHKLAREAPGQTLDATALVHPWEYRSLPQSGTGPTLARGFTPSWKDGPND